MTNKYFHTLKKTLKYILLYFIFQSIPVFILTFYLGHKYKNMITDAQLHSLMLKNLNIFSIIFTIIALMLYYFWTKNQEDNIFKRSQFNKINIHQLLYSILIAISINLINISIYILVIKTFNINPIGSNTIKTMLQSYSGIFMLVVLTPILEEIVFRGLIFNEMKKHLGLITSIILQATVFALYHRSISKIIYTFFAGIFFALVYNYTSSILASILCHISYNFLTTFFVPKILTYLFKLAYFNQNIIPIMITIICIAITMLVFSLIKLKKHSRMRV